MTNIGALKITENGDKKQESLIFVADSMGISTSAPEKVDFYQKLFHLGNWLMSGTGIGDHVTNTATELEKLVKEDRVKSTSDMASAILSITDTFGLTVNDGLNFIVGGKEKEGSLRLFHVNTTGNLGNPSYSDYKRRGASDRNYVFDGSGSPFVNSYVEAMAWTGKGFILNDLAAGLIEVFDFAKTGAKSTGVNDKFQFGIISDKGVSTLYHPDVSLSVVSNAHYLQTMAGVSQPGDTTDIKESFEQHSQSLSLYRTMAMFYRALETDLAAASAAGKIYTSASEQYSFDKVPLELVGAKKTDKSVARGHVREGVNALITRGLPAIIGYLEGFDARQVETQQSALALYQAQK